jgi:hypothetical protein
MHKLTKIKAVENPQVKTASNHDEYRESVVSGLHRIDDNHLSPNVEYWVLGEITQKPEIGSFLVMDRWIRNGTLSRGIFSTSKITSITEDGFETMNSIYKLEEVEDESILELTSSIDCV